MGLKHRWLWTALVVLVAIPVNLFTFHTAQNGPVAKGFYMVVQIALLIGAYYLIYRYRPNPLTLKKLKRFRSITRGYVSFVLLGGLMLITFPPCLLHFSRADSILGWLVPGF